MPTTATSSPITPTGLHLEVIHDNDIATAAEALLAVLTPRRMPADDERAEAEEVARDE